MPRRPSRFELLSQLPEVLLLHVLTSFSKSYNDTPQAPGPVTVASGYRIKSHIQWNPVSILIGVVGVIVDYDTL
jgi:hypothetical protein